jgi:hypothetical protein
MRKRRWILRHEKRLSAMVIDDRLLFAHNKKLEIVKNRLKLRLCTELEAKAFDNRFDTDKLCNAFYTKRVADAGIIIRKDRPYLYPVVPFTISVHVLLQSRYDYHFRSSRTRHQHRTKRQHRQHQSSMAQQHLMKKRRQR